MLSEDILLEIFDFYRLDAMDRAHGRPWKWLRLAHVCRRWRLVLSMSPRRLDLQIYCKNGASIKRTLTSWETLPLIVRYHGSQMSLPSNIAIALRHPDRVRKIDLDLTSTTVGSVVNAIKKQFQALEYIRITINDGTLPSHWHNVFLGGSAPRLQVIALDGLSFPFPEIKQVISSANNLVELHLSRIPKTGYFSADSLVTALSTSTQLRELEVSFHYPASLPTKSTMSPPLGPFQRTTFPSLCFLKFHGASEYLEEFASRVDLSQASLNNISIWLFNQIFFEIPQICRSIPFLNASKSPTEVEIKIFTGHVTIDLRQKEECGIESRNCYLNTLCERLDWKLSFVTQVSSYLSPLLESVGTLKVSQYGEMPSREDVDPTQWLELVQLFTHATKLWILGEFTLDIMQALATEEMAAGVLPELTRLELGDNNQDVENPAIEAAKQFVAARKLSGHTVALIAHDMSYNYALYRSIMSRI